MPTGNEANGQFFYEVGGERTPLEIGGLSLEDCSDIICDVENEINNPEYFKGGEISFNMPRKTYKKFKKVIRNVFPRYFTNNWRKIHGFPMTRRRKIK